MGLMMRLDKTGADLFFSDRINRIKKIKKIKKYHVNHVNPVITFVLVFSLIFSAHADAKNLGTVGAVYKIIEKDALSEIENKAKKISLKEKFSKKEAEKKIKLYKPEDLAPLPRVLKERIFSVDLTYTLDYDIPDGKGDILYPKGYSFNPLEYVNMPNTLVVINAKDKKQVEWFAGSKYKEEPGVMLLLSDGSYFETAKKLNMPVYYSNRAITEKFALKAVPSVIRQTGKLMEVHEIDVSERNKN